ncbi:MAG: fibronectin type III domain-containing protein [Spirochaetia bacterium]|nr:fibronectin type III domain-containing protein [Spirochaetia bacterium]
MKLICSLLLALAVLNCIGVINSSKEKDHEGTMKTLGLLGASGQTGVPVGGGTAGPSGMTLSSSDGRLIINIPPGAMTDAQEFTITKYTPATAALPGQYLPTTPAYEITPGYRFEKDVTVSISMDIAMISALNLQQNASQGFSYSSTAEDPSAARFPEWQGQTSQVQGDRLVMNTRTFSIFGGGTPAAGNLPPTILGAFYSFEPGLSYVPERVRAHVVEPDGNTMTVYLLTGPVGGSLNLMPLLREGTTDWYSADLPYESQGTTGVVMQVIAVDQYGANSKVPSNPFNYPASSGDATFIAGYDRDQDNDGYLDSWERDNGFNPNSSSSPSPTPDSDGDGIPNSADFTPNGEANPTIDSLTIFPSTVAMDIGESVSFAASASLGGAFRFVNPAISVSGLGSVGSLSGFVFTASNPGVTAVTAAVGPRNATASVTVRDSIAPANISNLSATAISHTKIHLQWTAPGDDANTGAAAAYEVRRATTPISTNTQCDAAATMAQTLTPKTAGLVENLDINGLSPSTIYYFCVRAYDSDGNRNTWTQGVVTATTLAMPDVTAPSDISGAAVTVLASDKIRLSWNAVGDDGNSGSASAYEIRRSTTAIANNTQCDSGVEVLNTVSPATSGSPLSFTVTGLSENTTYYFCIRAFDDANNRSNWNGTLSATTMNANDSPIANAGSDQTVNKSGGVFPTVTLSGNTSSDPDSVACAANVGSYLIQWSIQSSPGGSTASISNSTSLTGATFTPDVAGDYVVQLSFTDDPGLCSGGAKTSTDSVTVHAAASSLIGGSMQGNPLNLSAIVTTFAGAYASGGSTDGTGIAARFGGTYGMTSDGVNIYATDNNSQTIRKIVIATGVVTTIAGSPGSQGSADGTGSAARFKYPAGITMDGTNLYVTDTNNHTIRKVVIATGAVTTLAGSAGSSGTADGIGSAARFNQPYDLTTDGANLYVSDSGNNAIRKIVIATGTVSTFAGVAGSQGSADGTGSAARFYFPAGATTDGTNLYIPDAGNNTIRKIVIATGAVTTFAGVAGSPGSANGTGTAARFYGPESITTDGTNLYVTDTANHTIRQIVIATGAVTTLAGVAGASGSADGTGASARFSAPWGIITDGTSLYIQSQFSLRKLQ